MKYVAAVFLSLVLSGCYQTVNKYDMDKAVIVCKGYENIHEVSAQFDGQEVVTCKNGLRKLITHMID